ncbi:hypothetical protein BH20ACI2_BH20ACI2_25440 [soil metagenome]
MLLIETESLVLKSYNLAEADKIVVLLTKDQGVVRGVAKGAKRLKSKFGSGLEPFSIVHCTYFQKDAVELVSLQKIELIQSSFKVASNPEFLKKFSYLSDLLVSILPPHDPSEVLYRMFRACLKTASSDPATHTAVGVYFEVWLLRLAGYLPDWTKCDQCRVALDPTSELSLGADFHISCRACRQPRSVQTISSGERELTALAMKLSPQDFCNSSVDRGDEFNRLSATFRRMISQAIGREISNHAGS